MSTAERRRFTERVGAVRPSQLVYTFGVGSVVDLPNFSVVVGGLDRWERRARHRCTSPACSPPRASSSASSSASSARRPGSRRRRAPSTNGRGWACPSTRSRAGSAAPSAAGSRPTPGRTARFTLKNDAVRRRPDPVRPRRLPAEARKAQSAGDPGALPRRMRAGPPRRVPLDRVRPPEAGAVHRQPGARALRGAGRDSLHGHARAVHDLRGEAAPLACVRRAGGADDAAVSRA